MKPRYYSTQSENGSPDMMIEGKLGIADPATIIPEAEWLKFLAAFEDATGPGQTTSLFIYRGVPIRLEFTPGDGIYDGIPVDSGFLAEFPFAQAKEVFGFEVHPVKKPKLMNFSAGTLLDEIIASEKKPKKKKPKA